MRLELGFAVVMVAGATGLILALGLADRRRTFAILSALGAKPRQLDAFLWSEALLLFLTGTVIGGLIVGVTVNLAGVYVPGVGGDLQLAVAFAIIVAVLILKPSGLFGRAVVQRV